MKIAFDLDGVIIDKPPLVSKKLLEWLFRGGKKNGLCYRFPTSKLEQRIRRFSHFYLFRPPIKDSLMAIDKLARDGTNELYIVSARYSFLEKETQAWLKKRKVDRIFKKIYLNLKNEQPHLYKERIIKIVKPDIFIDDDDLIADFLAEKLPHIRIFCCYDRGERCRKAKFIKSFSEIMDLQQ